MAARYLNPDADPRGPYILSDLTVAGESTSRRYSIGSVLPPAGRSWRFNKPEVAKLEAEGRIVWRSALPKFKRYLNETRDALHSLLISLPTEGFRSEHEFIKKIIPRLAQILGYEEREIFYDYGQGRLRPDAVFSGSIESAPSIILEIKRSGVGAIADWIYQVRKYLESFDGRLAIVVSPDTFILISRNFEKQFDLHALSKYQVEKIVKYLDEDFDAAQFATTHPTRRSPFENNITDLIEAVEVANNNKDKGNALEQLAQFLIDSVSSLSCKYTNLITRSSEIDIVIEYDRSKGSIPLFNEVGRYGLVECKNWHQPVGASTIRDFFGKLEKSKIKLGIVFAKNGITGVNSGLDAFEEIRGKFSSNGVFVVVFSLEDLRAVNDSKSFLKALDIKADNLRFATQS